MKSVRTQLTQIAKVFLLLVALILGCAPSWGGDAGLSIFYTQYAYNGVPASVNSVQLQYTFASNSLAFSNNSILISSSTNTNFAGADGILINNLNSNLLIAGGGGEGVAGDVYQITQTGLEATPFTETMTPAVTTVYDLALVPANGSTGGFTAGTLIGTEKDFGYNYITVFPLSPSLAPGTAYPVTGDDVSVTSIAFGPDGTAYYGSGTETSDAGNFGIVTFSNGQFVTHRLFGTALANGSPAPGGVIFAGTHRITYDPFTGDIFTVGGAGVGQYDPPTNTFHVLTLYGPQNGFELSTPAADGSGHLLITADSTGYLVVLDYSNSPTKFIDAPSGIQFTYQFLAQNLAAIVVGSNSAYSGPPVITVQPQSAGAIVGQTTTFSVQAIGATPTYQWQSEAPGNTSFSNIAGATSSSYTIPPATLGSNGTLYVCVVSNSLGSVTSSVATFTVLTGTSNYITSAIPGTLRNNYSGWVGMSVSVGSSPLTITGLGRMFAAGNTGTHVVKIVNAATGNDVLGGSVAVPMSGGVSGDFVYANLPSSVSLAAKTAYYVLSQETSGGDEWYDWNTTAQTTSVATLTAAEYGTPYASVTQSSGHLYVPVDFKYGVQVIVTVSPTTITLSNLGTQTFSATVTGTSNSAVNWSLNPSVGSISTTGLYTAPNGISTNQTIAVTAVSQASLTASGSAIINLVPPAPPSITGGPQSQTVSAGGSATFSVTATGSGLTYQWQSEAPGLSSFSNISGATNSSYTVFGATLLQSGTQYLCVITNSVTSVSSSAATLTVTNTPSTTNYVTSESLGTLRSNFSGWIGMSVTVGGTPLTVTGLGRMAAPGDSASHIVKIVTASNSQNVAGGSVSIPMSGSTSGSFVYASLGTSVTLNANTTYYIMSQETQGGDQWYDLNTAIATTSVAGETTAIYSYDGAAYIPNGSTDQSYGPVDFVYTTSITAPQVTVQPQSQTISAGGSATFSVTASGGGLTYQWQAEAPGDSSFTAISGATNSSYTVSGATTGQSGTQYECVVMNSVNTATSNPATLTVTAAAAATNYVASFTPSNQRNDFTGWVGMTITVGSSPVTVTGLGRMFFTGNTTTHTVEIINVGTGQNVGSVSVPMAGGTPGQFVYASLASSVTLSANTSYYIASLETVAGDNWSNIGSMQTSSVASETSGVYSYDGTNWITYGSANQEFVPVDFQYTSGSTPPTQPSVTGQPQSQTVGVGGSATFSVTATGGGLTYQWQSEAPGDSSFSNISGATNSSYMVTGATIGESGTQYRCVVTNSVNSVNSNPATLTVSNAVPATNFVTGVSLGTLRNNFSGWIGMSVTVGGTPLTVTGLGRIVALGNTGSHLVKLVNASTSQDVTGGSVNVPTSGGTAGSFAYATLTTPVTLSANTTYYIVSQETSGGDQWYDWNTMIATSSVAVDAASIWGSTGYNVVSGSSNHAYGPVDFEYQP